VSIRVYLSDSLCRIVKSKTCHEVNGQTVGECLTHLVSIVPSLKNALFYNTGGLLPQIEVLIDDETSGGGGLSRTVRDGARMFIKRNVH